MCKRIQQIILGIVVLSCEAQLNLDFVKPNPHNNPLSFLSFRNVNDRLRNLSFMAQELIKPPFLVLGNKGPHNERPAIPPEIPDAPPQIDTNPISILNPDIKIESRNLDDNILNDITSTPSTPSTIESRNLDDDILNDITSTPSDIFETEASTETDLSTTTENVDYDDDVQNRISDTVVASLLG